MNAIEQWTIVPMAAGCLARSRGTANDPPGSKLRDLGSRAPDWSYAVAPPMNGLQQSKAVDAMPAESSFPRKNIACGQPEGSAATFARYGLPTVRVQPQVSCHSSRRTGEIVTTRRGLGLQASAKGSGFRRRPESLILNVSRNDTNWYTKMLHYVTNKLLRRPGEASERVLLSDSLFATG